MAKCRVKHVTFGFLLKQFFDQNESLFCHLLPISVYFLDHISYIYTPAIHMQSMDVRYKYLSLMNNCRIVLCNRIYALSFMYCL